MFEFDEGWTFDAYTDISGYYEFNFPAGEYDFMILVDPEIFQTVQTEFLTLNANLLNKDYQLVVIL